MADGCKIIVGLFKVCNGKVQILNCKIKLLKRTYMYINHSRGVDYVIQCRSDDNKYKYKYIYIYIVNQKIYHSTRHVRINVTMRCVHANIFAVKNNIYYVVCVSAALGIQHAMHIHHIVSCGLSGSTIFFSIISQMARFSKKKKKKLLNIKRVFCFLFYNFCL